MTDEMHLMYAGNIIYKKYCKNIIDEIEIK